MSEKEAYLLHPELRGKIKPAADSFFRDLDLSVLDAHAAEVGEPPDWRTPCAERDAARLSRRPLRPARDRSCRPRRRLLRPRRRRRRFINTTFVCGAACMSGCELAA